MTNITKVVSVLAALAVSSSAFAQTSPANPAVDTSAGLLGHRYAEYGFGYLDINKSDTDAFAAGLTINLPVAPSIDVALDYSYSWIEGHPSNDGHSISATGIYYITTGQLKPFGGLRLGYSWFDRDDDANWGAIAGVEYQLTPQLVLTGLVDYGDDFRSGDNGSFEGTVKGHYWFTRTTAGFLSVSLIEGGHLGFIGGVTFKF